MKIFFNKTKFKQNFIDTIDIIFNSTVNELELKTSDLEVNVFFVSKKEIRNINKEQRGVDKVTDVLSFPVLLKENVGGMQLIENKLSKDNFPNDINPETNNIMLGDIVICLNQAFKQAKEYGNSKEREVGYLAMHGLLHLLGYDHMTDDDKKVMRDREKQIIKNCFPSESED